MANEPLETRVKAFEWRAKNAPLLQRFAAQASGDPSDQLAKAAINLKDGAKYGFSEGRMPRWFEQPIEIAGPAYEHLLKLARTGRILAFTSFLSDSQLAEKLQVILRHHDTRLSLFNVSNVFDYDTSPNTLDNIAALPSNDDAVVITSAYTRSTFDKRDVLGSFDAPKAHLVSDLKALRKAISRG